MEVECYVTGLLSVFISRVRSVVQVSCGVVDVAAIDPCTCMSCYILQRLTLDVLHRVGFCRYHIILVTVIVVQHTEYGVQGIRNYYDLNIPDALELGRPCLFLSILSQLGWLKCKCKVGFGSVFGFRFRFRQQVGKYIDAR